MVFQNKSVTQTTSVIQTMRFIQTTSVTQKPQVSSKPQVQSKPKVLSKPQCRPNYKCPPNYKCYQTTRVIQITSVIKPQMVSNQSYRLHWPSIALYEQVSRAFVPDENSSCSEFGWRKGTQLKWSCGSKQRRSQRCVVSSQSARKNVWDEWVTTGV